MSHNVSFEAGFLLGFLHSLCLVLIPPTAFLSESFPIEQDASLGSGQWRFAYDFNLRINETSIFSRLLELG
jgi:hypothetical protein